MFGVTYIDFKFVVGIFLLTSGVRSIVPMLNLTWNLARSARITDAALHKYIKWVKFVFSNFFLFFFIFFSFCF